MNKKISALTLCAIAIMLSSSVDVKSEDTKMTIKRNWLAQKRYEKMSESEKALDDNIQERKSLEKTQKKEARKTKWSDFQKKFKQTKDSATAKFDEAKGDLANAVEDTSKIWRSETPEASQP